MIVVDIETSGLDFVKCGIWQIGAVDTDNPENFFLEEARLGRDDEIINAGKKPVLEVVGKTEEELRDEDKQLERELLKNFFEWVGKQGAKSFVCQNPQFDTGFIWTKANKYGLKIPFHYRAFDLHTLAQTKFYSLNKKFLLKENYSDMNLTNILNFVGIKDSREAHNALEDARLTAECFSRLIFGKNLIREYKQFQIPLYLK